MANVLLTEACVRSCPYCFAKQYMSETDVKDVSGNNKDAVITDRADGVDFEGDSLNLAGGDRNSKNTPSPS